MSIRLRLEGTTDILDLDGIAKTGVGFQALVGATGLGLPPVTPQWVEGAGDGAVYRGRRVRSRDIDLPLDILGRDRDHLKELTARLAKVLAEPCRLVVQEENGSEWYADAIRTGGGGFQYGIDTSGSRDLQLVITLTAGDPYFTSVALSSKAIGSGSAGSFLDNLSQMSVAASQTIGSIAIENEGDAEAYPVWTVAGPGNNFKAISPSGETLWWTGTLSAGETLTFDTKFGTVTDGTGANRYADLAPAPRFWSVPPGTTTSEASMLGTDANSRITCTWQARKWMVV